MGVTSSQVDIRINVVDGNTQQTVAQFKNSMDDLGAAGAGSAQKIAAGMDQARGHTLTHLDSVRLLRDEIGVHIPRAMEILLSKNQAVMKGLQGVSTVMAGIGYASIGVTIVEAGVRAVTNLYEKWLDVDGAISDYNNKAAEAAQQEFDKNRSLAQLNVDLKRANEQVDQLSQKKANSPKWWELLGQGAAPGYAQPTTIGPAYFGTNDARALNQATGQSDQAAALKLQKDHEAALANIRNQATVDEARQTTAAGRALVAKNAAYKEQDEIVSNLIARQKQLAAISERAGKKPGDVGYVPEPGAHDFDEERNQARARADATYRAASIQGERATAQEIRRLQEQADEAGLKGIALLEYQRKAADADWVREHGKSAAAIAAIDKKYFADEKKVTEEQTAALTSGVIKGVEAVLRQQQEVSDRLQQMRDQAAGAGLSGFARINAQGQRQIDDWTKFARTNHGSQADINAGVGIINAGTAQQSQELARRNTQETEQIEEQARIRSLSDEKQKSAAIYAEYDERVKKWKEALDQQELSQEDFNRRVVAAAAERDAELQQQAKEAHDKMAQQFDTMFKGLDHPLKMLQDLGDKVAGNFAATLVQKIQARRQGAAGAGGAGGGGWFDSGSIFGIALGGHGGAQAAPGETHPAAAAAGKVFALQSATIQVGQATIGLGATSVGSYGSTASGGGTAGATSVGSYGSMVSGGGTVGAYGASLPGIAAGGNSFAGPTFGGAGMGGNVASSTQGNFTAGTGSPPPQSNALGQAIGDVRQGISAFGQARSMFARNGSGSGGGSGITDQDLSQLAGGENGPNADGSYGGGTAGAQSPASGNGSMMSSGFSAGNVMGAASGALGLYSAYQGNGGVGGALSGAMSGMQLGMAVGGPIGAAIGAAAGAIVGAIGFGGREKARVYDLKQLRPRLANDMDSFQQGQMDYTSAYTDMVTAQLDAKKAVTQWGPGANSYYQDTMKPEVAKAEAKLTSEQKAGRSAYTVSAGQFDVGGPVGGFGSLATGPDSGWVHAQRGEFMVQQQAALPHYQALQAINGGASHADMARYYGGRDEGNAPAGDTHHHYALTVNAVDSKSFADMLAADPMAVRRALNGSQEHYAGVADV